jgi:two-component system, OmpR family, sensor histidine kinase CiaH
MKHNDYRQALRRLTAGYMIAIVIGCAIFTVPFIALASRSMDGPAQTITQGTMPAGTRVRITDEGRRELLLIITTIDVLVIGGGSVVSYLFARQTLRPLEAGRRAQERFTADASHELRTPLTVLKTQFDIALKHYHGKPKQLEQVIRTSLQEVETLKQLTDSLLALNGSSTAANVKAPIDISAIMQAVVKRTQHEYGTNIASDILPDIRLPADSQLFARLVYILLDNACKYSQKPNSVSVSLTADSHTVRLIIQDAGIGITTTDLPHVFDRFYRGSNTARLPGHGLGLAIAHTIAEAYGWDLRLISSPDDGTTVTITLPL